MARHDVASPRWLNTSPVLAVLVGGPAPPWPGPCWWIGQPIPTLRGHLSMRKTRKAAVFLAAAAVAAGVAAPATAAAAATGRDGTSPLTSVAFSPGSGQSVVDWNKELITILGTPGAQPATVHPTRSFAI